MIITNVYLAVKVNTVYIIIFTVYLRSYLYCIIVYTAYIHYMILIVCIPSISQICIRKKQSVQYNTNVL